MSRYGPHRPEDAPTHVDLAKGKAVRDVKPEDILMRPREFPQLAPGARRQRKQLNDLAYTREENPMTNHGCPPEAPTCVEGPDPLGQFAVVCLGCGLVLTVAEDREELYADL